MDIRERIIEGAAELFRIYGIKSVTMDSIATHLGISKRTIYETFGDKDDLLTGVLNSMSEKQKDLVRRVLDESDNAIQAIFKLLEINNDHIQKMSPAFQSDMKKFHHEVLLKISGKLEMPDYMNNEEVIQRGIREKLFRKNLNIDLVNRCTYLIARSIMDNELFPFEQFSRREVISSLLLNYLRGICTPEGIELINKLERKY